MPPRVSRFRRRRIGLRNSGRGQADLHVMGPLHEPNSRFSKRTALKSRGQRRPPFLEASSRQPPRPPSRKGGYRVSGATTTATCLYIICICIYMPSRNIAVQSAVFGALEREKRAGESFTDLFRRMLDQRGDLDALFGAWGKNRYRADRAVLKRLRMPLRPRR